MRTVAIIVSTKDPAGMNVKEMLLEIFPFKETGQTFEGATVHRLDEVSLYTTTKETIDCNHLDRQIDAELFVFATKHRAASGTHSLSVHVPGNWGKAELGGFERRLCIVPASMIRIAFLELQKRAVGLHYEITLEATHHGPSIDKPCFFIEIGSDETQWQNREAARIIAETIIAALKRREETFPTVMVIGGGHYNHTANKILLRSGYAVGHICAKHCLKDLDREMIQQAIERTVERVEMVILDWKGLGDQKENIRMLSENSKIPFERSKEILHYD
jgi:D-aminoacyl-tRNA deacylase